MGRTHQFDYRNPPVQRGQTPYLFVKIFILEEGSHVSVVVLSSNRVQLKQRLVVVLLQSENCLKGYGSEYGLTDGWVR